MDQVIDHFALRMTTDASGGLTALNSPIHRLPTPSLQQTRLTRLTGFDTHTTRYTAELTRKTAVAEMVGSLNCGQPEGTILVDGRRGYVS